jgi:hypothetical protein
MNGGQVRRPIRRPLSNEDTEEKWIQRRKMWAVIAICLVGAAAVAWDLYRRFHPPIAPPTALPGEPAPTRAGG